jgi:hypothetical protein
MRRSIQTLILSLAALGFMAVAANAMTVHVNESRRVALRGVAANIVVGDTSVADVALTDAHSVIVMGKGYGSTQLLVTDARGRTLLAGEVTVTAPDNGRVTLYRGLSSSEFACDGGRCHSINDGKAGSGGGGGFRSAPAGSSNNAPTIAPPPVASTGGEAAAQAAAAAPRS